MQRENSEQIARNLIALGTVSYEDIAKGTGLPISEIEKMANLELV